MNLKGIVKRIEAVKKIVSGGDNIVAFHDGKSFTGNILKALLSVINGNPNAFACSLLNEYAKGNYDTAGLYHEFEAYNSANLADIWEDEIVEH